MKGSELKKLALLSDTIQTSLDDRSRLIELGVSTANEDEDIRKNLQKIKSTIEDILECKDGKMLTSKESKSIDGMKDRYDELVKEWGVSGTSKEYEIVVPERKVKQVRFDLEQQNQEQQQEQEAAVRNELFVTPYKDDPEDNSTISQAEEMENNEHYGYQQQLLQDQDAHLDNLAISVNRQHMLSLQINDELAGHLELLDSVDNLTDGTQSRLANAKKRLEKVSRRVKSNGSWLTIGILLLVFIILLVVLK